MLDRLWQKKSRLSLDHFNLRPCQLFLNPDVQDVFASYKIILFHITHLIVFLILPSIHISIPIISQARGAPFSPSLSLFPVCPQDHRLPLETSLKLIALYPCALQNGLGPLFVFQTSNFALTHAYVSAQAQVREHTAVLQMQDLISFDRKELDQCHDGWMTTCSFVYEKNSSQLTIHNGKVGTKISLREANTKMVVGSGLEDMSSKTALSRSLTKIVVFQSRTYQILLPDQTKIAYTPAISRTLTENPPNPELLGKFQRMHNLPLQISILASSLIYKENWYIFPMRRSKNTCEQFKNGMNKQDMCSPMSRNCMENSYIPHSSFHKAELTSQLWRTCCSFVLTNLFDRCDQSKDLERIWSGGMRCFNPKNLQDQYHALWFCTISQLSRMPVPPLALLSSLETDGEHGSLYQDGTRSMVRKTLAGQKRSGSNFSFDTLSTWVEQHDTSKSTETTKGSSRVGEMDGAGTRPSIPSIAGSMHSSMINQLHTLSIHSTSKANSIQQMNHLEESTEIQTSSYQQLSSQLNCVVSSPTNMRFHSGQTRLLLSTIPSAAIDLPI